MKLEPAFGHSLAENPLKIVHSLSLTSPGEDQHHFGRMRLEPASAKADRISSEQLRKLSWQEAQLATRDDRVQPLNGSQLQAPIFWIFADASCECTASCSFSLIHDKAGFR